MMVVGVVSSPEQARELENITKLFVIGNRARKLGHDAFMIKQLQILRNRKKVKGDK